MITAVVDPLDLPDTDPATGLPKMWPLAEVAKMLDKPFRDLRERARRREFTHVRVSQQNIRLTTPMLRALIAQLTKESADDASIDRDRERADRRRDRGTAAPKPRRTAA